MVNSVQEVDGDFTKRVSFEPAYDRGKEGGRGSAELWLVLSGPKGAISFSLFTGWMLPSAPHSILEERPLKPTPADVSYHSRTRKRGSTKRENCIHLDGEPCWSDGSGIRTDEVYRALREKGLDGAFESLKSFYEEWLGG